MVQTPWPDGPTAKADVDAKIRDASGAGSITKINHADALQSAIDAIFPAAASILTGTVNTIAVGETDIVTFPTATDTVYHVEAIFLGKKTDFAAAASYRLAATFRNDGGTLTQIGTTAHIYSAEDTAAWDAELDADGTNIRARVNGAPLSNIDWLALLTIRSLQ